MKLEKTGIRVEATNAAEIANFKRLGYVEVLEPPSVPVVIWSRPAEPAIPESDPVPDVLPVVDLAAEADPELSAPVEEKPKKAVKK